MRLSNVLFLGDSWEELWADGEPPASALIRSDGRGLLTVRGGEEVAWAAGCRAVRVWPGGWYASSFVACDGRFRLPYLGHLSSGEVGREAGPGPGMGFCGQGRELFARVSERDRAVLVAQLAALDQELADELRHKPDRTFARQMAAAGRGVHCLVSGVVDGEFAGCCDAWLTPEEAESWVGSGEKLCFSRVTSLEVLARYGPPGAAVA